MQYGQLRGVVGGSDGEDAVGTHAGPSRARRACGARVGGVNAPTAAFAAGANHQRNSLFLRVQLQGVNSKIEH